MKQTKYKLEKDGAVFFDYVIKSHLACVVFLLFRAKKNHRREQQHNGK